MIHVIYRSCDKAPSVHGIPRPFARDKGELIRTCFHSLFTSARGTDTAFTVVGDDLSADLLAFYQAYGVAVQNHPPMGNDRSLLACLDLACSLPDETWVYFCEDDYLHRPKAVAALTEFIADLPRQLGGRLRSRWTSFLSRGLLTSTWASDPIYIHPSDYPDRYDPRDFRLSLILRTPTAHWRQIHGVTFTFLVQAKWVKKHRKIYARSARGANDGYLSKMLLADVFRAGRGLAFSPIPSLAAHMHETSMPLHEEWESVYREQSAAWQRTTV